MAFFETRKQKYPYTLTGMRTKRNRNIHNKTMKTFSNVHKVCGSLLGEKAGWKMLRIYGEPYERGFAHGYLLKKDLKRVLKTFPFLVEEVIKVKYSDYIKQSNVQIKPQIKKHFPEYYAELKGISDGAKAAGVDMSVDFLIGWNSHMSLTYHFKAHDHCHCSAFIATGNATKDGDIVMAHNTHTDFATGQLYNIVMRIEPKDGYPFVMQTCAGLIASVSDWFICSTGIIGCETTIHAINYVPKFGVPFFCRIREAMQYGKSLDDYVEIMKKNNAGDYACSWQFGDINTNEIMLLELGLKHHSVQRTKNGLFYGANSVMDEKIRKTETHDIDHSNISSSVGARNYRLNDLLNNQYYGKIDLSIAKKVMADHYDVYLKKNERNSRGICKHLESSIEHCKTPPFYPRGCTDAKVTDTQMAKDMAFWGRFGSGCGRKFSVKKHIRDHPEWKRWASVVEDFKGENWIKIAV
jgi:hypothetical protein